MVVKTMVVDHQVSDSDSRFVCIDNNDNVVVEGEEPISELCKECYAANSRLQTAIEDFLVEFDFNVIISIGDGESIGIGPVTDTIEELCFQIENSAKIFGVPLSSGLLKAFLLELLEEETGSSTAFEDEIDALIECLVEAGVLVDKDLPGPITDNPITTQSNNPIQLNQTIQ